MTWKKLGLDWVGDRIGYHNNPPPIQMPKQSPLQSAPGGGMGPMSTGQNTLHFDPNSTQPVGVPVDIDPGTLTKVKDWLSQNWDRLGSGMTDLEKWQLALQTLGGAANAYTNYTTAQGNLNLDKANLAEKQREYNTSNAPGLIQKVDTAPLRDQASYMLGARLGMVPGSFTGQGLNQPGTPGGIDQAVLGAKAGAYTPGAGGTYPGTEIYKKMLASMGYPYPTQTDPNAPKKNLTDVLNGY